MPYCWIASIAERIITDSKQEAVIIHITDPAADCSSKENGPIVKPLVMQKQAVALIKTQ